MLILIGSVLLLNGASGNAALKNKRHNQEHHAETSKQKDEAQTRQTILVPSTAFQAALLQALRTIVSEEVARQKQRTRRSQRLEHDAILDQL
jgi:hypothetical protein